MPRTIWMMDRNRALAPLALVALLALCTATSRAGTIAVPGPGDLVLFDFEAQMLYRFDPVAGVVEPSTPIPEIDFGRAVAVDGRGRIVLLDVLSSNLRSLDDASGPAELLELAPGEPSQLSFPTNVIFDDDGSLLVTNAGPSASGPDGFITRLRPVMSFVEGEGTVVRFSQDTVASGLREPVGLAADASATLWVMDKGDGGMNGSLYRVSPGTTTPVDVLPGIAISQGADVAVARDGTILALDFGPAVFPTTSKLVRLDPQDLDNPEVCFLATGLNPRQMSVDTNGDLIVSRTPVGPGVNRRVAKIDVPESGLSSCDWAEIPVSGSQPNPNVDDVAIYPNILNQDILATGQVDAQAASTDGLAQPGRVLRLRPGGLAADVDTLSSDFSDPVDVAIDRLGQVLVIDRNELALKRIDPDTGSTPTVSDDSDGDCMDVPEAIALDESGQVLIFDPASPCGEVWGVDPGSGGQEPVVDCEANPLDPRCPPDCVANPSDPRCPPMDCLTGSLFHEPIDIVQVSDYGSSFGKYAEPDYLVLDRNAGGNGPGIIMVDGDTYAQTLYEQGSFVDPVRLAINSLGDVFVADQGFDKGSPAIVQLDQPGVSLFNSIPGTTIKDLTFANLVGSEVLLVSNDDSILSVTSSSAFPLVTLPQSPSMVSITRAFGNCGQPADPGVEGFAFADATPAPSVLCIGQGLQVTPERTGSPFVEPFDIAGLDERYYHVVDKGAAAVFTLIDGQVTHTDDGDGLLVSPNAIAGDSGSFYVADEGAGTLIQFPGVGSPGRLCADGSFDRPGSAALQPQPKPPAAATLAAAPHAAPPPAKASTSTSTGGEIQLASLTLPPAALPPSSLSAAAPAPSAPLAAPAPKLPPDGIFCEEGTGDLFDARQQRLGVRRGGCAAGAALGDSTTIHQGAPFSDLKFVATSVRGDVFVTDFNLGNSGTVWILRKDRDADTWAPPEAFFPPTPDPSFRPLGICIYEGGEVNVASANPASGLEILQLGKTGSQLRNLTTELGQQGGGLDCVDTPVVGGSSERRLVELDVFPASQQTAGLCPEGDGALTPDDARLALALALELVEPLACDATPIDPARLDVAPPEEENPAMAPPQIVPGQDGAVTVPDAMVLYRTSLGLLDIGELR